MAVVRISVREKRYRDALATILDESQIYRRVSDARMKEKENLVQFWEDMFKATQKVAKEALSK